MRFPAFHHMPFSSLSAQPKMAKTLSLGTKCIFERLKEVVIEEWIVLLFHWPVPHSTLSLAISVVKSRHESMEKTVDSGGSSVGGGWLSHIARSSERKGLNSRKDYGHISAFKICPRSLWFCYFFIAGASDLFSLSLHFHIGLLPGQPCKLHNCRWLHSYALGGQCVTNM